MPAASVIVPARDAEGTLGATLRGLEAQDHGDFEVIVVDDASRDGTARLAAASPAVSSVIAGSGRGPAEARNLGAERATGEVLAFLDADCEPVPGWLSAGAAAVGSTPPGAAAATGEPAGLVQGRVLPRPGVVPGPFDRTLTVTRAWGLFESANLFVARDAFARAGGFESWLRPRRGIELGEDVWLGWRLRRAGVRSAFCSEALAYHEVFPRGAGAYIGERARARFFAAMAARMPELREEFLWRRVFLSRRSAMFDLAVLGALAAARRRSALPLFLAAPYAREAHRHARRGGARAPAVAAADVAADAVGMAASLAGSARWRSLVL